MDTPPRSLQVYVRFTNQWVQARPYQIQAYEEFLKLDIDQTNIHVPHPDGGEFVGIFRRGGEPNSVDWYTTELGKKVEITYFTPEIVGYINRIMNI